MTKQDLDNLLGRVSSKRNKAHLLIGIDPGTHTGFAVFSNKSNSYIRVESMKAVEAEDEIMVYKATEIPIHVFVEDTRKLRLPKALQSKGRDRGAGSVGRDMGRWQEFLEHHNIPHTMTGLSPKEFRAGDDAWFRKKTGWDKRTNDHSRCAAGVIWGR